MQIHDDDRCEVIDDRGRIEAIGRRIPSESDAIDLSDLFKLFGDPTRTRMMFSLLEGGELCVCSIAEVVGVTESKVSQHLRLLRAARVVDHRKEGRMVYYQLRDSQVRLMLDLARDHLVRLTTRPT